MNSSLSADARQKLVTAYLGHRLNHSELVALTARGDAEPISFRKEYAELTARDTDRREAYTPEQLDGAWRELGLKERFQSLDESKIWSAEERAIHRRLSQPGHDPTTGEEVLSPAALSQELTDLITENFNALDRDGDLRLELDELDYLMSGGVFGEKLSIANDRKLAPTLTTLMRYDRLLGSGQPADGEGISQLDVGAWRNDPGLIAEGSMGLVNEAFQKYSEEAKAVVLERPLSEEIISPEVIRQGVAGSCVLLATIAGTPAEQLNSMLKDNGDGTLTVAFADGVSETLNDPTLAERLYHSSGSGTDRWPALLEIAAAQRLAGEGKGTAGGLRGTIEGISPEFAIPALSGRPIKKESLDDLSLVQTRELVSQAMSCGGPVICGSRPRANRDFVNVEELHNGIANGHCYSVQGYNPEADTVKLQNPWHKTEWVFAQDGADEGVFEMPLRDFYSSFRWLGYAQPRAS